MRKEEEEARLSLILIGLSIGFFLGGLAQVMGLPSWVQVFGSLFILLIAFVLAMRSISQ